MWKNSRKHWAIPHGSGRLSITTNSSIFISIFAILAIYRLGLYIGYIFDKYHYSIMQYGFYVECLANKNNAICYSIFVDLYVLMYVLTYFNKIRSPDESCPPTKCIDPIKLILKPGN